MKLAKITILAALCIFISILGFCDDSLIIDETGKIGIGTSTPQKALHVVGDIKATGDICSDTGYCLSKLSVPVGGIIMWSGSIASIPEGWALCDGSNGTPNLYDRFVIHADADSGGKNNVGATGGSNTIAASNLPSHRHGVGTLKTSSAGSHNHSVRSGIGFNSNGFSFEYVQTSSSAGEYSIPVNSSSVINSGGAHTHSMSGYTGYYGSGTAYKPRYYALAYIMKL